MDAKIATTIITSIKVKALLFLLYPHEAYECLLLAIISNMFECNLNLYVGTILC